MNDMIESVEEAPVVEQPVDVEPVVETADPLSFLDGEPQEQGVIEQEPTEPPAETVVEKVEEVPEPTSEPIEEKKEPETDWKAQAEAFKTFARLMLPPPRS